MDRFFNNAGPTVPADHYCIDPLSRVELEEVEALIAQRRYFVLHAPRQTGKTTCLLELMRHLNEQGRYACVYSNIEAAQVSRNNADNGMATVCDALSSAIRLHLKEERPEHWLRSTGPQIEPKNRLERLLQRWTEVSELPTVLLLDEVDALVGDTLIALLRQLRAGYAQRPQAFPQSVVLCGVRDVRDYRIQRSDGEVITGGSAFNVKAESLRLGNFSEAEVRALWQQHTEETGQVFDAAIFPELWEDTYGQPWLVNALGYELTWRMKPLRERSRGITLEHYLEARENLIQSRAVHLDQLSARLEEDRVRRVIEPLLETDEASESFSPLDIDYVLDLGLIRRSGIKELRIANRIYQEVVPRELSLGMQWSMSNQSTAWYVREDGSLDFPRLLQGFQQFFREHSESWIERFQYKEAGPQLLLQAFLQRIVNGGGRISREYGLGRRRTDLFIEWPLEGEGRFTGALQRIVLELKLMRRPLEAILAEGLPQTADYADRCGAEEAHLLLFDQHPERSWEEKIWHQEHHHHHRTIQVWGL
jgi:hypothetical protein